MSGKWFNESHQPFRPALINLAGRPVEPMMKWRIFEYILFPLFTVTLFFLLSMIFISEDQAITIGGDSFGHMADYSLQKKGLQKSDICVCLENKGGNRFKPFRNFIKKGFIAMSDSPSQFINAQFIVYTLAPFFLSYYFCRSIIGRRAFSVPLSLILAFTLAFSSFNILHLLTGHFSFFPLFVLVWLFLFYRFYLNPNNFNTTALGLGFGINAIFNPYYGYFGVFLYPFFIGYILIYDRERFRNLFKKLAVSFLISGALVISIQAPVLLKSLTAHSQPKGTVFNRPASTITGIAPWNYLMPAPTHLAASESYSTFYRKMMAQSNVPENAVYLGMVNLFFFGYGIYLYFMNRLCSRGRFWFRFVFGAGICYLFLSLPPNIDLGNGKKIDLISPYLHAIFPMFRTFGRTGLFVLIFVSIGSMIGFYHFLHNCGKKAPTVVAAALILSLIDLAPRLPTLDIGKHPPVYDWLKNQKGNFLIYEIPEDYTGRRTDNFQQYKFRFYQAIHGKKLANRGISNYDPQSKVFYQTLKKLGVKYLVQHKNLYQEGPLPQEYKKFDSIPAAAVQFNEGVIENFPEWFVPAATIGEANVYEVY
ncbi:MAG: hypothetical protein IIA62_00130 [Nitrospinae bacterium]|nr:hypothetical protein [Nitrospinota bacterium]